MPSSAQTELCTTCSKPIRGHTLDDAIDCNKAGYWLFLLKKGVREDGITEAQEAEA